jgi:hypothetical protein
MAECGRRDVQPLGCTGEVQLIGRRDEVAQQSQVDVDCTESNAGGDAAPSIAAGLRLSIEA